MRLALAAALLISTATPALAAPLHSYSGLALSPAGDRIASVEGEGFAHGKIVIRSARDGHVLTTIDPCAACSYSGLTFGAGGALAWLQRDRASGTVTLVLGDGKAVRTIATIKGIAQTPRFSPDGKRIALLVTIGAAKESGATQPGVRQVGEIGETNDEQRIAVFDLAGKPITDVAPVSPADRYVYEYDWTPDSTGFVATTALGNGDNNWWVATLDAIDARTGAVRNIATPKTQINFPRISPDGRTVAFIGGLMSDFGSVGGDIWTVPFAGGDPVDVTKSEKATVTSLDWTRGGIRDTRLMGADGQVAALIPGKGTQVLWAQPSSFSASDGRVAYSADGSAMATIVSDFEHAPAIYAGPTRAPRKITSDNDSIEPVVSARSITWTNDGYTIQGWLVGPRTPPATKAAMIVNVHGGPSAASTPRFVSAGSPDAEYVNAGYYVFYPNPRGSYGQGEAFTAANKRDFGGGDLRDILAGVDAAERAAPIDDSRLGLTGGSYGGFMAMWANTQTNRFKAIVAGAGLSDWISYYGTNGIDQWMIPFFGKSAYDDPKPYVEASAITYIKKARTPTFIYVGERDIEVPPTQSIEYWHALKEIGVPTTLMIYPDEGHGIRQPEHLMDLKKRVFAWWAKYLGK
ncbi:S9 family peptidase [Sphingomonas sp.]|jgi:dipeptidyl aminopeptidase/acylaminoacyl peptidase|uniref:S9 family peptidase n=1 Tax=Sphingomonas sp. TaxID=28214 RepID=UPI002E2F4492|nr:S9 family peptidase [Sphingomonas sp.]HEX4694530.1 S9 family peptidase [Sphingomonas sp.]